MAERKIDMAVAFIQSHPHEAARLAEQLDPGAVASLLHRLPTDPAALLLQSMLPQYTARVTAKLDASRAAELLPEMDQGLVVVVLRHLGQRMRRNLLENMPARSKATSALLLNYAPDTVGAWMQAQVFTLPEDCTAGEALKRLAAEPDPTRTGTLFVLGRDLRVRGTVQVSDLLRADAVNPVLSLAEPAPPPLLGRATLLSVRDHRAWESADVVPVLNRHHQFIGTLSHARLRRGLAETTDTLPQPVGHDAVHGISEVYGSTMFALMESLGEASGLIREAPRREG